MYLLLAVIKALQKDTHLNPTFSIPGNVFYEPQPPKAEILYVTAYKTPA